MEGRKSFYAAGSWGRYAANLALFLGGEGKKMAEKDSRTCLKAREKGYG